MHKIKRRWWDRQWSRGCFGLSIQNSQKYITTSQISLLVQDIMKDITKARSWKAFNKCLLLEENVWLPVITLLVNIHNLRICHNFQNLPSIFCVKKNSLLLFSGKSPLSHHLQYCFCNKIRNFICFLRYDLSRPGDMNLFRATRCPF